MRPKFNKSFTNAINTKLYSHDLTKLSNALNQIISAVDNALAKNTVTVSHVITDNDTLRSLAIKYYKDVSLWRKLALYNTIDTVSLVAGNIIEIPERGMLDGI